MNKKSLLLFAICFSYYGQSQQLWFQGEDTWVHRALGGAGNGGFMETKFEKDTIINGQACKKFTKYFEIYGQATPDNPEPPLIDSGYHAPIFMYASSDDNQVYYYQENIFKLIYDFTKTIGETIELPFPEILLEVDGGATANSCPNTSFNITATGTDVINGVSLKYLTVEPSASSNYVMFGKIYQKIGSENLFFTPYIGDGYCPQVTQDFNRFDEFRCFTDVNFSYHIPIVDSDWGGNCDIPGVQPTASIDEFDLKNKFQFYPNPASDYLTIKAPDSIQKINIQIVDVNGKEIYSYTLKNSEKTINVSALNNGLYFLIINKNTYKLVVNK